MNKLTTEIDLRYPKANAMFKVAVSGLVGVHLYARLTPEEREKMWQELKESLHITEDVINFHI